MYWAADGLSSCCFDRLGNPGNLHLQAGERNFGPQAGLEGSSFNYQRNLGMKKAILAFAVFAALSTPSFAQSVGEKTGVNSALGIAPKTEDFIKQAAISDMTEIEAAKIAQSKGNADEKKFAEMMLTDHTKTSNELKALIPANMKAAVTTALDDASQKKLAKLRDAKPEDFASEYDPMQVSAHKNAVSLFERYANGGDEPQLKEWAGKTLPALKHHLELAQALDNNRK
jgi:putative membrane protein